MAFKSLNRIQLFDIIFFVTILDEFYWRLTILRNSGKKSQQSFFIFCFKTKSGLCSLTYIKLPLIGQELLLKVL